MITKQSLPNVESSVVGGSSLLNSGDCYFSFMKFLALWIFHWVGVLGTQNKYTMKIIIKHKMYYTSVQNPYFAIRITLFSLSFVINFIPYFPFIMSHHTEFPRLCKLKPTSSVLYNF